MTTILGLDPGRDKCGVAVARPQPDGELAILQHEVIAAETTISAIAALVAEHHVTQLVLGNQTSSAEWQAKLEDTVNLPLVLVDERNSTLEARDRYWKMYPAAGLRGWIPQSLRSIPGPVDGIVAILLIERYLAQIADEP